MGADQFGGVETIPCEIRRIQKNGQDKMSLDARLEALNIIEQTTNELEASALHQLPHAIN